MTMDLNTDKNLIERYEEMASFANHHINVGGQLAHRLVKEKIADDNSPRQGGRGEYYEGYDDAIKHVLDLLRKRFVP